jgi:hypothetical protein
MQQSVLTSQTLNIENTVLTVPKLNKVKQLSAGIINTTTRSALYIETPYLINAFGLTYYDGGKEVKEEDRQWSLSLKAVGGQGQAPEDVVTLFEFLKQLDEKTIDYGIEHSQTIFKKKYTQEQRNILVDLLYNRGVKPSVGSDGTVYPDRITLKVMKNDQKLPELMVFKDSEKPLNIDSWETLQGLISKGMPIKAIIQPKWYFVNGKMGINYRVLQVKLPNQERIGRPLGYAFSEPPSAVTKSTTVEKSETEEVEVEEEVIEVEEEDETEVDV